MKIGIIRHFKVDYSPWRKIYSADQFSEAMKSYESAPIIPGKIEIQNSDWEICYCSTIPRAIETAKRIFKGEIIYSDKIIEVPVEPFTNRKIILPSCIWHIGGRIAWYRNHKSQPEKRSETLIRINDFLNEISARNFQNVLIVTHAFFIRILVEELEKRGYSGKLDPRPMNGKLYVFKKEMPVETGKSF